MEKKERLIEVRTAEGRPILSLHLTEREVAAGERQGASASQTNSQTTGDSSMTDAQKRYLFRILADQGMEADAAHQRLKKLFGVDSLQQVSKREASGMIEQLLEENERR